ncbi:MAG: archaeosortase/exosortase family protein [Bryobacterales bacterium]|nr:archaeosortase/exosortase family protein [Bryobacterales bacterium]
MPTTSATRHALFAALSAALLVALREPLSAAIQLSRQNEQYSHTLLIPWIAFGLILYRRQHVFTPARFLPVAGIAGLAAGILLAWWAPLADLTLKMVGFVVAWVSAFLGVYGAGPAYRARYPLAMLFLAVPLPPALISAIETVLQHASAEVTHVIFQLTGTTMFRDGLVFSLPGVQIEVARECSGIRSSIALFIAGLVLAHLFLLSARAKVLLVLLTIPITIAKNALRIATISWLGTYVSTEFFYGPLHRRGGLPFSVLALFLLTLCLLVVRRWDGPSAGSAEPRSIPVEKQVSRD